jgi:hypothetical protein
MESITDVRDISELLKMDSFEEFSPACNLIYLSILVNK